MSKSPLPTGWEWTTLEHCVDILDNKRVPINRDEREKRIAGKDKSALYPYYGATGLVGWIDDYIFDEEIVLLGEDGAPFLESNKDKAYIVRGKCWVNNHAHVLRAKKGLATNLYLAHYLNTFDYKDYVTGTTRLKLNQARMRDFPIPLPPLPEQERIVRRIESLFTQLDAGVAGLRRAQAALRRYKASLLKAACEGRLVPQDPGDEPAEALLRRLGRSPLDGEDLPELPPGWCWARVGDITKKLQYGTSEKANIDETGIPVLRMGNIQDGELDFKNLKFLPESTKGLKELILEPGDILFNRTNSAELVGKTAVYQKSHPKATFASYLIRVIVHPDVSPVYVSSYINSFYGRRYIASVVSQQVGQANVNGTKLSNMPIPVPPLPEQQRIVAEVERRLSVVQELEAALAASLARASRLRQAILKQAFEGRL